MLKISQAGKSGQPFTLKLEGRLVGPWVNELQVICDSLLSEHRPLKLDLSDVAYADTEGVELLADLKLRQVTLENESPFLKEQLKTSGPRLV
jgi:ABC-type transporter Mla MlaB component